MRDHTLIGPWVRRFLLEHLVTDRNLARNTQLSYRDTLVLLLPFMSKAREKAVDRLTIDDLSPFGPRYVSRDEALRRLRGGHTFVDAVNRSIEDLAQAFHKNVHPASRDPTLSAQRQRVAVKN